MDKRSYLGYDEAYDKDAALRRMRYAIYFLVGMLVSSIPDAVRELIEMYYR